MERLFQALDELDDLYAMLWHRWPPKRTVAPARTVRLSGERSPTAAT